jgi:thiol-disulfide isomerase/thioredoxin
MELALPSIAQLLRSKPGLQALLEFYTGVGPPNGTRVDRVHSVTEWKDALIAAGSKLVVVMFSKSTDVGCRILNPMFLRLPEANEGEFADGIAFVRVEVDGRQDDGLALQVFDEIGIAHQPVPTFAFLHECLELRKWRYQGADVGKIVSRIRKLKVDPTDPLLRDGPDEDG